MLLFNDGIGFAEVLRHIMIILGIDPGLATVGYGVVNCQRGVYRAIEYGAIITKPHQLLENRLEEIYDSVCTIIERHAIDCMAVEELFFNRNVTTAIDVCQARRHSACREKTRRRYLRIHPASDKAIRGRVRQSRKKTDNLYDAASFAAARAGKARRHRGRARGCDMSRQQYARDLRS